MPIPVTDIETRVAVWEAFGELFLDTEVALDAIVRVCAGSPYSVPELQAILFNEVWPALYPNLFSVAGEWAGWDRAWLVQRILARRRRGSARFWWLHPGKRLLRADWLAIRRAVEALRAAA